MSLPGASIVRSLSITPRFRFAQRSFGAAAWLPAPPLSDAELSALGYKLAGPIIDSTPLEFDGDRVELEYINEMLLLADRCGGPADDYMQDRVGANWKAQLSALLAQCPRGGPLPPADFDLATNCEEYIRGPEAARLATLEYARAFDEAAPRYGLGRPTWSRTNAAGSLHGDLSAPPGFSYPDILRALRPVMLKIANDLGIPLHCDLPRDSTDNNSIDTTSRRAVVLDDTMYTRNANSKGGVWRLPGAMKPGKMPKHCYDIYGDKPTGAAWAPPVPGDLDAFRAAVAAFEAAKTADTARQTQGRAAAAAAGLPFHDPAGAIPIINIRTGSALPEALSEADSQFVKDTPPVFRVWHERVVNDRSRRDAKLVETVLTHAVGSAEEREALAMRLLLSLPGGKAATGRRDNSYLTSTFNTARERANKTIALVANFRADRRAERGASAAASVPATPSPIGEHELRAALSDALATTGAFAAPLSPADLSPSLDLSDPDTVESASLAALTASTFLSSRTIRTRARAAAGSIRAHEHPGWLPQSKNEAMTIAREAGLAPLHNALANCCCHVTAQQLMRKRLTGEEYVSLQPCHRLRYCASCNTFYVEERLTPSIERRLAAGLADEDAGYGVLSIRVTGGVADDIVATLRAAVSLRSAINDEADPAAPARHATARRRRYAMRRRGLTKREAEILHPGDFDHGRAILGIIRSNNAACGAGASAVTLAVVFELTADEAAAGGVTTFGDAAIAAFNNGSAGNTGNGAASAARAALIDRVATPDIALSPGAIADAVNSASAGVAAWASDAATLASVEAAGKIVLTLGNKRWGPVIIPEDPHSDLVSFRCETGDAFDQLPLARQLAGLSVRLEQHRRFVARERRTPVVFLRNGQIIAAWEAQRKLAEVRGRAAATGSGSGAAAGWRTGAFAGTGTAGITAASVDLSGLFGPPVPVGASPAGAAPAAPPGPNRQAGSAMLFTSAG